MMRAPNLKQLERKDILLAMKTSRLIGASSKGTSGQALHEHTNYHRCGT